MSKAKTYPSEPANEMKATTLLHALGQSLWVDNITRDLLDEGTLKRYIDELSVTGLTSNPTICLGQHRSQRSDGSRASLRQSAGGAFHYQHHAGRHVKGTVRTNRAGLYNGRGR